MSTTSKLKEFYADASRACAFLNAFVSKYRLEGRARADHICYKCDNRESFEAVRKILESESEYVFQSIISRRRIAYIKLKKPIKTRLGDIWFLELADQKPDLSQDEGFDHVEVYPLDCSYEEMIQRLKDEDLRVIEEVRPHHTTHDVTISRPDRPFIFRCTREPLIDKIKREEML